MCNWAHSENSFAFATVGQASRVPVWEVVMFLSDIGTTLDTCSLLYTRNSRGMCRGGGDVIMLVGLVHLGANFWGVRYQI